MGVGTIVSGVGVKDQRGNIVHPTSLQSRASVVVADATETAWTVAQAINVDGWASIASVADIKVLEMGDATRVRVAARASTGYSAVAASPAVVVIAVDADAYDAAGGFTNLRSAERIDATDQDAAGTALTFQASPDGKHVEVNSMFITEFTSDLDAKGRPYVAVIPVTAFSGTGSGTVDIIAETPN
jgi:hypothetical protein